VKRTMEVSIMGQKFMLRSDSDDGYVQKVAKYVDGKIDEVVQNTKSVASLNVAILAAMNIADEYLKYQNQNTSKLADIEKRISDLVELIDLQI